MLPSWIARLVAVVALTSAVWCAQTPVLARTVAERFPIVVDAEGVPDLAETATAGLTLVSLDNALEISFGATLYLVPDARVAEILSGTPIPDDGAGGLPAWLDGATPIGGPGIAAPAGHTEAVVDLVAGSYAVVFDVFDPELGTLVPYALEYDDGTPFLIAVEEDGGGTTEAPPTPIEITGAEPTETAEVELTEPTGAEPTAEDTATEPAGLPDETATVVMTDDAFLLPAAFPVGPQTWEVVNQGQLTHALIVVTVPAGTTADQLRAALFPSATESAAVFDASAMTNVGGLGPLAPGLSAAASLDLPAGTYAVFSALPDPTTGQPDGAQGLLAIFFVG